MLRLLLVGGAISSSNRRCVHPADNQSYYPQSPGGYAAFPSYAASPSNAYGGGGGGGGGGGYRPASARPSSAARGSPAAPKYSAEEAQRQARYPGIRPKSAVPQRPDAPFQRPGVDAPVRRVDAKAVRGWQEAFVAKHERKTLDVPAHRQERFVSPVKNNRIPDNKGYIADRIAEVRRALGTG